VELIIGYSWIDGHLPVLSDPGIGWSAAWRRWTLVAIGMRLISDFILVVDEVLQGAALLLLL
jgi:hypothetical protein